MTSPRDQLAAELVMDTSVLINLTSVERWRDIVASLPDVLVPVQVMRELCRNPRTGRPDEAWKTEITAQLKLCELREDEADRFLKLVSAEPANSLGDGEAATLAVAEGRGALPVIDERKARRVSQGMRVQPPISTVSIYRELLAAGAFSEGDVRGFVLDSLSVGKMHVTASDAAWVLEIVGLEQAAEHRGLRRHLQDRTPRR